MNQAISLEGYKRIFANMGSASCINEIVYENGKAVDYRVLEINKAFENLLGAICENFSGRLSADIYGVYPPLYFDIFVRVAETGTAETFDGYFPVVNKHLRVSVSCPEKGKFSNVLHDITQELLEKESIRRSEERLKSIVNLLQRDFGNNKELLNFALHEAISLTHSKIGYIYRYSEETQEFILNTWSKGVLPECSVINPESTYKLEKTGIWGEAVRQRTTIIVNDFKAPNSLIKGIPEGHVKLTRFLTVPVFQNSRIVAVVGVANKESDYDQLDSLQLQLLMDAVWKKLEQRKTIEDLHRIEWMLSHSPENDLEEKAKTHGNCASDVINNGLILNSVGHENLQTLVGDYLDFLNTSAVVFEISGERSLEKLQSDWCVIMNEASIKKQKSASDDESVDIRRLSCREICWAQCCKKVIEKGEPLEIECAGGIRIYAAPILAKDKIIGALSFGYGDPPKDQLKLQALSQQLSVPYEQLEAAANSYHSRPAYIIEMARKRLHSTAKLIGSMVETRQVEDQLLQAMKMDAIGRLAGGVAHDFNNMLSVILGQAELVMLEPNLTDNLQSGLENIILAGKRSADLTRQLLAFARKQAVKPEVLDLNHIVSGLMVMLKRLIGENIDLSLKFSHDKNLVKMDPAQIDQILVNLVVNAREAISGTGKIIIETGVLTVYDNSPQLQMSLMPGKYAMLAVSDNGCGMNKEVQAQIFEPFFTTKPDGIGTGLGLATVYGIVKQNNGAINIYSEEGHGATFKVFLPLVEEVATTQHRPAVKKLYYGSETVLLVEDEKPLLLLAKVMLEKLGYRVIPANSPIEALKLTEDYPDTINLVLTDVIMPDMNGSQMYEKISQLRPDTRCLFMSGYTADIINHQGVLAMGCILMEKPFDLATMSQKIREALD